jgi:hypothetical protein
MNIFSIGANIGIFLQITEIVFSEKKPLSSITSRASSIAPSKLEVKTLSKFSLLLNCPISIAAQFLKSFKSNSAGIS